MDREHDDLFVQTVKIDCVRKSRKDCPPGLSVGAREGKRVRQDARDDLVNGCGEVLPKSGASCFVPLTHLDHFIFGLWPENNLPRQPSAQQLPPHFRPRYRGPGILEVFSPTPIEFRALLVGERQFPLALPVGKTLPQSHREFSPITGRKLEEFCQGGEWHALMFSRAEFRSNLRCRGQDPK
jgi:hypothetical protein